MTEELRLHWSLHELDELAVAHERVLAKHPEQRTALLTRIAAARAALAALDQRVADSAKRRRILDGEIAAFDDQQKHFEKQLLAVTNQQQFEAVQHEIAAVKARRDVLETEVLVRLDTEEREARTRTDQAHALERAEGEAAALFARLDAEHATLRAELAALEARRAHESAQLPPVTRTRYEKLRAGCAGRAVAAVVNGACGSCFRGLPPAGLQEARRREKLLTCSGCGRLLLMPPEGHESA